MSVVPNRLELGHDAPHVAGPVEVGDDGTVQRCLRCDAVVREFETGEEADAAALTVGVPVAGVRPCPAHPDAP